MLGIYQCGPEKGLSEIPLGIGYLMSNCDKKIEYVNDIKELKKYETIGLSATAAGLKEAIQIRKTYQKKKIIIGGQGTLWGGLKEYDFEIIKGEGEEKLNKHFGIEKKYDSIDDIRPPVRGKCDKWVPVVTSRGCPFKCSFCSAHVFWQKPRLHSAEYVVDELKDILFQYKKNMIYIYDDLFIIDIERLEMIAELLERKNLKFKFRGFVRSNLMTEKVVKLLKRLNFKSVRFGAESGSDRILKLINKKSTVEDHQRCIDLCNKYDLPVCMSIMSQLPYETDADRQLTKDFIQRNKGKCDISGNYIFKPFPGTEFYKGENPLLTDMEVR